MERDARLKHESNCFGAGAKDEEKEGNTTLVDFARGRLGQDELTRKDGSRKGADTKAMVCGRLRRIGLV